MPMAIENPEWTRLREEQELKEKDNARIQEEMNNKIARQQARYHAISIVAESFKIAGHPIDGNKTIAQRIIDQADTIYEWLIKDL